MHDSLTGGQQDFVLLDVRGTEKYAAGHVPGALDLAQRKIIGSRMAAVPGRHAVRDLLRRPALQWRGARRVRLAQLGRPVKIMSGGITGWLDEGFTLERSAEAPRASDQK